MASNGSLSLYFVSIYTWLTVLASSTGRVNKSFKGCLDTIYIWFEKRSTCIMKIMATAFEVVLNRVCLNWV